MDEARLPDFYELGVGGIWAPKGTPKPIIDKLNAAVVNAVDDPTVRERLTALGWVLFPREQMTPQVLAMLSAPKPRNGGPSSRPRASEANKGGAAASWRVDWAKPGHARHLTVIEHNDTLGPFVRRGPYERYGVTGLD